MAQLDFGSVPDYLPALTVLGGFVYAVRAWRKERRDDREADERRAALRETGAAMVTAGLYPPEPPSDRGSAAMRVEVRNDSAFPVFDVEATVRYCGQGDVPAELRVLREVETIVPSGERRSLIHRDAEEWPEGGYERSDFEWVLTFRDVHGLVWRRGRQGLPELVVDEAVAPSRSAALVSGR